MKIICMCCITDINLPLGSLYLMQKTALNPCIKWIVYKIKANKQRKLLYFILWYKKYPSFKCNIQLQVFINGKLIHISLICKFKIQYNCMFVTKNTDPPGQSGIEHQKLVSKERPMFGIGLWKAVKNIDVKNCYVTNHYLFPLYWNSVFSDVFIF